MSAKSANRKDTIRAAVALLVCGGILAAFVVVLGGFRFWEKFDVYHIRFLSVKDLSPGRPVKYGGLDVGRILSIGVDPQDARLIRVDIGIRPPMVLHHGVVARIAQKGLVGDYYVFLDPQETPGQIIAPGSYLPAVESVDMAQLAGIAGEILSEMRPKLENLTANLERLVSDANVGRVSAVLAKAPALIEDMQAATKELRAGWGAITGDGRALVKGAGKSMEQFNATMDVMRKEMQDTLALMRHEVDRVGGLTQSLQTAVAHDQAQVEDILDNVNKLTTDLKHLSGRLRERPWEVIRQPEERKP